MFKHISYQDVLYPECIHLRSEILRKPLGLTFDSTTLSSEQDQFTLGVVSNNHVTAVCMLKEISPVLVKMRQVAVAENAQGKGLGAKLVQYGLSFAREKGYLEMELNARLVALNFWEKQGFKVTSEEFEEVGIPHVKMVQQLNS